MPGLETVVGVPGGTAFQIDVCEYQRHVTTLAAVWRELHPEDRTMTALLEPFAAVLEAVVEVGMTAASAGAANWRKWIVTTFWILIVAILVTLPFAILLAYGAPLDSRTWW